MERTCTLVDPPTYRDRQREREINQRKKKEYKDEKI